MFSQDNIGYDSRTGLESLLYSSINTGTIGTFFNKPKDIVGNIYVFENWNNSSKIAVGNEIYKVRNINLNIKSDRFEAKIGKDSMFAFSTSNIDYIIINNRKFKNFYDFKKGKNRNFELIYEGKNISLLKGYEVGVRYNDPDPLMVKKNVDNYFTTVTYFIKEEENINQIKLKKKNILNLFKSKSSIVDRFVKENKLSYKKEKDLNKIFIFYESL
jgi:hypothetical protein